EVIGRRAFDDLVTAFPQDLRKLGADDDVRLQHHDDRDLCSAFHVLPRFHQAVSIGQLPHAESSAPLLGVALSFRFDSVIQGRFRSNGTANTCRRLHRARRAIMAAPLVEVFSCGYGRAEATTAALRASSSIFGLPPPA